MECTGDQSALTVGVEISQEIGVVSLHDDVGRYDQTPHDGFFICDNGLPDSHFPLLPCKVVRSNTQLAIAPLFLSPGSIEVAVGLVDLRGLANLVVHPEFVWWRQSTRLIDGIAMIA